MTTELTTLLADFNAIYEPLVNLQETLASAVRENEQWPLWTFSGDREAVACYITTFEYDDGLDVGETTYLPAVVGLPPDVCALIGLINQKRAELVSFLKENDHNMTEEGVRVSKYILGKVQLRRFNRKAVARRYIELDVKPDSIRYMWSQTRTITKMTVKEAAAFILRRISNAGDTELRKKLLTEHNKILTLPEDEVVARVYIPAPQPRVNMVIKGKRVNSKTAMMPIFYPSFKGDKLPNLIPLAKVRQENERLQRSDLIIEKKAFAPLSRIHLYKTK